MRDTPIKFRAWDTESKKMVEEILEISPTASPVFHYKSKNKLEWMQFTGLKDIKGKEIYEGDLCKVIRFEKDEEKKSGRFVIFPDKYEVDHYLYEDCEDTHFGKPGFILRAYDDVHGYIDELSFLYNKEKNNSSYYQGCAEDIIDLEYLLTDLFVEVIGNIYEDYPNNNK